MPRRARVTPVANNKMLRHSHLPPARTFVLGDHEVGNLLLEVVGLVCQGHCGCRGLFNHRGILLRNKIKSSYGRIDLRQLG